MFFVFGEVCGPTLNSVVICCFKLKCRRRGCVRCYPFWYKKLDLRSGVMKVESTYS
jgi:hypothetical protein